MSEKHSTESPLSSLSIDPVVSSRSPEKPSPITVLHPPPISPAPAPPPPVSLQSWSDDDQHHPEVDRNMFSNDLHISHTESRMEDLSSNKRLTLNPQRFSLLSKEEKRKIKQEAAIEEVLHTERKYIQYIATLKREFMNPLLQDSKTKLIPEKDVQTIFGNLSDILNINSMLLSLLEEEIEGREPQAECSSSSPSYLDPTPSVDQSDLTDRKKKQPMIGQIFLRMYPYFKVYTRYCFGYNDAIECLARCRESNPAFKEFIRKKTLSKETFGLSLSNFLIMPIQRVPRYALLLRALLDYTEDSHPDYKNLENALQSINQVVTSIDNAVVDTENRQKVVKIQSLLVSNQLGASISLVEPHRRLVCETKLTLCEHGKFCKSHLFLFNDLLILSKPYMLKQGMQQIEAMSNLSTLWVIEDFSGDIHCPQQFSASSPPSSSTQPANLSPSRGHISHCESAFWILLPGQSMMFIAESQEEKEALMLTINDSIAQHLVLNSTNSTLRAQYCLKVRDNQWTVVKNSASQRRKKTIDTSDQLTKFVSSLVGNIATTAVGLTDMLIAQTSSIYSSAGHGSTSSTSSSLSIPAVPPSSPPPLHPENSYSDPLWPSSSPPLPDISKPFEPPRQVAAPAAAPHLPLKKPVGAPQPRVILVSEERGPFLKQEESPLKQMPQPLRPIPLPPNDLSSFSPLSESFPVLQATSVSGSVQETISVRFSTHRRAVSSQSSELCEFSDGKEI